MKLATSAWAAIVVLFALGTAHAAFIVEADNVAPVGKANDHFSAVPANGFGLSSTPSTALGLTGNQSAFGNPANATGPDVYTLRYSPGGGDVDNTVFAAGTMLGNSSATDIDGAGGTLPTYVTAPQLATGLTGGASGLYNVYFTIPASTNVNGAGSIITINNDLLPVVLNPVLMNSGDTGPDDDLITAGHQGGANNRWLRIATVPLTAGNTYTVVIQANADPPDFVSQRTHGVMWEFVGPIIPEPSSFVLAGLGLLGLAARRRSA